MPKHKTWCKSVNPERYLVVVPVVSLLSRNSCMSVASLKVPKHQDPELGIRL